MQSSRDKCNDKSNGTPRKSRPRASWIILAVGATLTILSGLYVGLTPTGSQTELSARTWEQFAAAGPEVITIYAMSCVGTPNGGNMPIVKANGYQFEYMDIGRIG